MKDEVDEPLVNDRLNYLTPTIKAIGYATDRAGRRKGIYDKPRTPFDRLLAAGVLSLAQACELTAHRQLFWRDTDSSDQVGQLEGGLARFGKTYAGEPDQLVADLAQDEAVAAADSLLLTVPNQLGVDYNAHIIEALLTHVAPALGWRRHRQGPNKDPPRVGGRAWRPCLRWCTRSTRSDSCKAGSLHY